MSTSLLFSQLPVVMPPKMKYRPASTGECFYGMFSRILTISDSSERWRGCSTPLAGWGAADVCPAPPRPHFEPQLYGLRSGWWTAGGLRWYMCGPHEPYPERPALSTHRTDRQGVREITLLWLNCLVNSGGVWLLSEWTGNYFSHFDFWLRP